MEELRGALGRLVQRLQRPGPVAGWGTGKGGGEEGGGGGGELQEDAADDEERQHAASQVKTGSRDRQWGVQLSPLGLGLLEVLVS